MPALTGSFFATGYKNAQSTVNDTCCDMSVRNRRFYSQHAALVFLIDGSSWGSTICREKMDNILNEAFQATDTAKRIAEKKCDLES